MSDKTGGLMHLFEVTNGWMGESYVRSYVWANNETEALALAGVAFLKAGKYKSIAGTNLAIRKLFSATDAPFATIPSDTGFNDEGK